MRIRFPVAACVTAGLLVSVLVAIFFSLHSKSHVLAAQNDLAQSVPIRIIVVESPEEAQQILDRLKNGEDFGQLAREKSIDPSAGEGGSLGDLAPSALRPELRDALENLPAGKPSSIVKTASGYAILEIAGNSGGGKVEKNTNVLGQSSSPFDTRILQVSATSSIRLTPDLSGMTEEAAVMMSAPKPPGWDQDPAQVCKVRTDADDAALERMIDAEAAMDRGDLKLDPSVEQDFHYTLAEVWGYHGEMAKAISEWEKAYQIAQRTSPDVSPQIEEDLAISYLHKAEIDNDVLEHPGDRCILPLHATYAKTESSQKAIEYFLLYLKHVPSSLEAKFLLNIAYMTIGAYPQGVPKEYLIPPDTFRSKGGIGRFTDVASQAGLNVYAEAGGLIVDDFDNDGFLDVVTSSMQDCAPMRFFHNNGDGTFTDRTAQAGLSGQLGGLNMIQTDYNNDGCLDILVLRGGWELPKRKSLLRNNCDGTFTDVTREAGLAEPATATQTAVWTDINNDGYLDLFVGNENSPSQLFLNKGDGTFVEIGHSAGVDRVAFTKAVVAADYDNDGYPDLYVSNSSGEGFLYHNNRDLTFTEVSKQAGVEQPKFAFPAWFFDYDNDGWPDLLLTSYYPSEEEEVASLLHRPLNAQTMKLYKNMHNGTFKDVTVEVGLDRDFMPMGSNFGDIDNDGYLDFYLGTGNPSFGSEFPHALFHNQEGRHFEDVTMASGTGDLHWGHGVSFADLENNGNEDIIEENGGPVPGSKHALRLFRNPGNGNDWINVHLVGVKTNRAAVGARIKVTVESGAHLQRDVYRTVGSGGSFGASPFAQNIGLGKAARIKNIEIWWPTSNTRQNFADVEKNQFIEIKEFAKDYTKLVRHSFTLGEAKNTASNKIP